MLKILHTNDFHGCLRGEKLATMRAMRESHDLYFDSGDGIKAGNLGVPLKAEAYWPALAELECTASCPGNRETHVLQAAFEKKLAGRATPLICANLYDRSGTRPLSPAMLLLSGEVRVGVFSVMVPMVTQQMATQAASAYLWTQPLEESKAFVAELRPQVDLLIALTHIGLTQDRRLAALCPEIDLILGGHSHNVLELPEQIGQTRICQGGSHGRFAGSYVWEKGLGLTKSELVALPASR